jgi:hypothetical protein
LSTKIVISSYPKLLSFSVLTSIKWRLTPSYAAKDTIFWTKKKTQNCRYQNYCLDDNIQIYSYGLLCEHVPKNHMLFIVSKLCACSRRVHIEGHMNRFEYCHPDNNSDNDSFGSFFLEQDDWWLSQKSADTCCNQCVRW